MKLADAQRVLEGKAANQKMTIHRIKAGSDCTNEQGCSCGPIRVEKSYVILWIHRPVLEAYGGKLELCT